jgi:hypothetical protein
LVKKKKQLTVEVKDDEKKRVRCVVLDKSTFIMLDSKRKELSLAFTREEFKKAFDKQLRSKSKMIGITFTEVELRAVLTAMFGDFKLVEMDPRMLKERKDTQDMLYR